MHAIPTHICKGRLPDVGEGADLRGARPGAERVPARYGPQELNV